jgi:cell division protein FtsQ
MARSQAARAAHAPGRIRRVLRHALKAGVLLALVAAAAGAWGWLADPATFPIRDVRVQGGIAHVPQARLREAIDPFVGAGLLRVDVDGLRTAVEALPWIRRAAVRRTWPATLVVAIEEQRPLARWADGGLLNVDGERFMPEAGTVPAGLPLIAGPAGSEKAAVERYGETQRMLQPLGFAVARLSLDARRALELELESGLVVRLGRRQASGRLLRFVRSYAKALAPRITDIESVDLRYTNGFAVQWKAGRGPATV